jgi:hypothetical protein
MRFRRKSENIDRQIEQLELRLEDLQVDGGAATLASARSRAVAGRLMGCKVLQKHRNIRSTKTLFVSSIKCAARNAAAHLSTSARTFPSGSIMYRGIGG